MALWITSCMLFRAKSKPAFPKSQFEHFSKAKADISRWLYQLMPRSPYSPGRVSYTQETDVLSTLVWLLFDLPVKLFLLPPLLQVAQLSLSGNTISADDRAVRSWSFMTLGLPYHTYFGINSVEHIYPSGLRYISSSLGACSRRSLLLFITFDEFPVSSSFWRSANMTTASQNAEHRSQKFYGSDGMSAVLYLARVARR